MTTWKAPLPKASVKTAKAKLAKKKKMAVDIALKTWVYILKALESIKEQIPEEARKEATSAEGHALTQTLDDRITALKAKVSEKPVRMALIV